MSATAFQHFSIPSESNPISPLLDLAVVQTHSQAAYVYRFDRTNASALLEAFAGPAPAARELHSSVTSLHWNRKTPVVLESHTAADWRFCRFPEFQTGKFEGVVSVPLLESAETVGVANFCRVAAAPVTGNALSFLLSLALPLGALLAASTLRDQLDHAQRLLADRKLFERAKGLLQARFSWTEEEAYLRMRNLSRRCRTPMREIARLVIESGTGPLADALTQND